MDNLADFFYYDETSPSGLRHKTEIYKHNQKTPSRKIGDVAGYKDYSNRRVPRWRLAFRGNTYLVHRIIMTINTNYPIPTGLVIDHIDGNPSNNSLDNIRITTIKQNNQNNKKLSTNTSGFTGVQWDKPRKNLGALAVWRDITGKRCVKYFSVNKFGLLPSFAMAVQFREDKIAELNGKGANYTDRHGT